MVTLDLSQSSSITEPQTSAECDSVGVYAYAKLM